MLIYSGINNNHAQQMWQMAARNRAAVGSDVTVLPVHVNLVMGEPWDSPSSRVCKASESPHSQDACRLSGAKEMECLGSARPFSPSALRSGRAQSSKWPTSNCLYFLLSSQKLQAQRFTNDEPFWSCVCFCEGLRGPPLTPWGRAVKAEYAPLKNLLGPFLFLVSVPKPAAHPLFPRHQGAVISC